MHISSVGTHGRRKVQQALVRKVCGNELFLTDSWDHPIKNASFLTVALISDIGQSENGLGGPYANVLAREM